MSQISLSNFTNLAAQVSDQDRAIVQSRDGTTLDDKGAVGSALAGKERRIATMDAFVEAVESQYGKEGAAAARNVLRNNYENGKPLMARQVSQAVGEAAEAAHKAAVHKAYCAYSEEDINRLCEERHGLDYEKGQVLKLYIMEGLRTTAMGDLTSPEAVREALDNATMPGMRSLLELLKDPGSELNKILDTEQMGGFIEPNYRSDPLDKKFWTMRTELFPSLLHAVLPYDGSASGASEKALISMLARALPGICCLDKTRADNEPPTVGKAWRAVFGQNAQLPENMRLDADLDVGYLSGENSKIAAAFSGALSERVEGLVAGRAAGIDASIMRAGLLEELQSMPLVRLERIFHNDGGASIAGKSLTQDLHVAASKTEGERGQALLGLVNKLATSPGGSEEALKLLRYSVTRLSDGDQDALRQQLQSPALGEALGLLTGSASMRSLGLADNAATRERVAFALPCLNILAQGLGVSLQPAAASWSTASPEALAMAKSVMPDPVEPLRAGMAKGVAQASPQGLSKGTETVVAEGRAMISEALRRADLPGKIGGLCDQFRRDCDNISAGVKDAKGHYISSKDGLVAGYMKEALGEAARRLCGQEPNQYAEKSLGSNSAAALEPVVERAMRFFQDFVENLGKDQAVAGVFAEVLAPLLQGAREGVIAARDNLDQGGMGLQVRMADPNAPDARMADIMAQVGLRGVFSCLQAAAAEPGSPLAADKILFSQMEGMFNTVMGADPHAGTADGLLERGLLPGFSTALAPVNNAETLAMVQGRLAEAVGALPGKMSPIFSSGGMPLGEAMAELETTFKAACNLGGPAAGRQALLEGLKQVVSGALNEQGRLSVGSFSADLGSLLAVEESPFQAALAALNGSPAPVWAGFARETLLPEIYGSLASGEFSSLSRAGSAEAAADLLGNLGGIFKSASDAGGPDMARKALEAGLRQAALDGVPAGQERMRNDPVSAMRSMITGMSLPASPFMEALHSLNQAKPPSWAGFARENLLPTLSSLAGNRMSGKVNPFSPEQRQLGYTSIARQRAELGLGAGVYDAKPERGAMNAAINEHMADIQGRIAQGIEVEIKNELGILPGKEKKNAFPADFLRNGVTMDGRYYTSNSDPQRGTGTSAGDFARLFSEPRHFQAVSAIANQVMPGIILEQLRVDEAAEISQDLHASISMRSSRLDHFMEIETLDAERGSYRLSYTLLIGQERDENEKLSDPDTIHAQLHCSVDVTVGASDTELVVGNALFDMLRHYPTRVSS